MPSSSPPEKPEPPEEDNKCPTGGDNTCNCDDCDCNCDEPTSPDDCPPSGENDDGTSPSPYSPYPVRYSTGQIRLNETDLSSNAFGLPWGHTRSYANVLSNNGIGMNGNSWLVGQLKSLIFVDVSFGNNNPDEICVLEGGSTSRWFKKQSTGHYVPLFSGYDTLDHDTVRLEFVLTTRRGRQFVFYDNSSSQNPLLAGLLKAVIDRNGRVVTATYNSNGLIAKFEQEVDGQTSGFYYQYFTTGSLTGRLSTVTLKVRDALVRRGTYGYYNGEAGGSTGDLKRATVEKYDPGTDSWKVIKRKHYRYYTTASAIGFVHGLKFAITGAAYQRMVNAGLSPETAPEAVLANYANFYFEYDSEHRVTKERVEGGRKQFTLSYTANPDDPGVSDVNTWYMKTVETLPDDNVNHVYSNRAGQVILKILKQTVGGGQWYNYAQFDSQFHVILAASSFAVDSVTEPSGGSNDLVVELKADEGLIRAYEFYDTTNPTTGAVAGYLKQETVQEGEDGDQIIVRKLEYATQTAFGQSIHPYRAELLFPLGDNNEANASRTEYEYTWYLDGNDDPTFQMESKTTTFPAVSSGQNGSGVAGVEVRIYDIFGQVNWVKDQRGAITYMTYDAVTGAKVETIADVDTARMSDVPSGWTTVAGWGLHLIFNFVSDDLGRIVQARGPWHEVQLSETDPTTTPIRQVGFKAYLDEQHETREATGYMTGESPTSDFRIVGAVKLTRRDDDNNVVDQIQCVRSCTCGPLSADESFPQEKWSRWTHHIYDTWGRLYATQVYFKIPVSGEGDVGANYLETVLGYDVMGRPLRTVEPSGTIQRMVRDSRGLVTSNWTGTDDRDATDSDPTGGGATGNNMKLVTGFEYDNGAAGGNGNITEETRPVDGNSANDRVTLYSYDFRDRRVTTTASDGTTTWIGKTTYDNLNRPTEGTRYHTSVANGNRISRGRTFYDALGRIFKQETDGVDPSDGDITGTLVAQNWYDLGENIIKQSRMGSTAFIKIVYDALNRPTVGYLACVPGTAGVPSGDTNSVSSDTVLEQQETTYDAGGNVIMKTVRKRLDDASGTGPLQSVDVQPKARRSYVGRWPDAIGRVRVSADFGTCGGAALVRPAVAPVRSDVVLVTTHVFKDNGDSNAIIDPMGIERRWENDQAGRRVKLIENYLPGRLEKSRVCEYAWHASGQLERLMLVNGDTGNQVTRWIYGTTLNDSEVANNNLLRAKIYPESDDRPAPLDAGPDAVYARLEYSYNRQKQRITIKDADETVHGYDYNKVGRLVVDTVPNLGEGLDDSVLRIERSYDVRGYLRLVTSYDAPVGGDVVNQVELLYDSFSNLVEDRQAHSGTVGGGSPKVVYAYPDGSQNTMRRSKVTYPDGRELNVLYGAGNSVDDHLNRVSALEVEGEGDNLVEYTYCGAVWQVRVEYPQPEVELTYKKQGSEPVGDSGDPYNGYDRFGRTVDLRWQSTSDSASLERIQYGFDRDSRRTWRRQTLATSQDNSYGYDGLSQVVQDAKGNLNLNQTAISAVPATRENWEYDPSGNWRGYETQSNGSVTLAQHRIHDKGNRLTQIENDPNPILLDRAGRMRQVPPDASGDWSEALELKWDAWSRITQVKQVGETEALATYAYDGLKRRVTRDVEAEEVVQHIYYSDAWRPLEERKDEETDAAAQYLWGARHRDDLVRRDRDADDDGDLDETRYALMDYYSPASITDGTGTVTERYAFSAFGIRRMMAPDFSPRGTSECAWEFAFQGQFLDPESGMLNYGYRYYSPFLGRWTAKDPIGLNGGINLYGFTSNSPTNLVDFLGLEEYTWGGLGQAMVGGAVVGGIGGAVVGGTASLGTLTVPGWVAGAVGGGLAGGIGYTFDATWDWLFGEDPPPADPPAKDPPPPPVVVPDDGIDCGKESTSFKESCDRQTDKMKNSCRTDETFEPTDSHFKCKDLEYDYPCGGNCKPRKKVACEDPNADPGIPGIPAIA